MNHYPLTYTSNPFLRGNAYGYWKNEAKTSLNYCTFGAPMPGLTYKNGNAYRFSFNGKEDDMDANIGYQDYGMRIYDTRLGRFLSVDPLTAKYPELTPYQFSSNSPVANIDLDGLEKYYAANGALIGQIGDSPEKRTVTDENVKSVTFWVSVATHPQADPELAQRATRYANNYSTHQVATFTDWYSEHAGEYNNQVDAYRAWQSYPGYHEGESKFDRMARTAAAASMEARKEYASGGYDMYSGYAKVAKSAQAVSAARSAANAAKSAANGAEGVAGAVEGAANAAEGATTALQGAVKSNYARFVSKMPANAKSSATFKQLENGNYLFEATSPGQVPGSSALYQKWVNAEGATIKMIKTTFAPDGSVIHVKPKL